VKIVRELKDQKEDNYKKHKNELPIDLFASFASRACEKLVRRRTQEGVQGKSS